MNLNVNLSVIISKCKQERRMKETAYNMMNNSYNDIIIQLMNQKQKSD